MELNILYPTLSYNIYYNNNLCILEKKTRIKKINKYGWSSPLLTASPTKIIILVQPNGLQYVHQIKLVGASYEFAKNKKLQLKASDVIEPTNGLMARLRNGNQDFDFSFSNYVLYLFFFNSFSGSYNIKMTLWNIWFGQEGLPMILSSYIYIYMHIFDFEKRFEYVIN